MTRSLIEDLGAAATRAADGAPCKACDLLLSKRGDERTLLREALAGTIGIHKLVRILHEHDIPLGRKAIERHRREKHS